MFFFPIISFLQGSGSDPEWHSYPDHFRRFAEDDCLFSQGAAVKQIRTLCTAERFCGIIAVSMTSIRVYLKDRYDHSFKEYQFCGALLLQGNDDN